MEYKYSPVVPLWLSSNTVFHLVVLQSLLEKSESSLSETGYCFGTAHWNLGKRTVRRLKREPDLMTSVKRRQTGGVHCKDTVYCWKCLSCSSTCVPWT